MGIAYLSKIQLEDLRYLQTWAAFGCFPRNAGIISETTDGERVMTAPMASGCNA